MLSALKSGNRNNGFDEAAAATAASRISSGSNRGGAPPELDELPTPVDMPSRPGDGELDRDGLNRLNLFSNGDGEDEDEADADRRGDGECKVCCSDLRLSDDLKKKKFLKLFIG